MLQPWWYNRELKVRHFSATMPSIFLYALMLSNSYRQVSFLLQCIKTIYPRVWTKPLPNDTKSPLLAEGSKMLTMFKHPNMYMKQDTGLHLLCHCRPLHCYYCPAVVIQYKYHFMRTRFLSIFLGCGFFITTIDLLCWYNTCTWTGFRWIKWTIAFHHPDKMHLG